LDIHSEGFFSIKQDQLLTTERILGLFHSTITTPGKTLAKEQMMKLLSMVWFAITKSKLDGLHSTTTNQRILSEDWI
jgi:hypothetical protein